MPSLPALKLEASSIAFKREASNGRQWTSPPPAFKVIVVGPGQNLYQDPVTNEGHDTLEASWTAYNLRRADSLGPSSEVISELSATGSEGGFGTTIVQSVGTSVGPSASHLPSQSGQAVEPALPRRLRGHLLKRDTICRCFSAYRRRLVVLEESVLSWFRLAFVGGNEVFQGRINLAAHTWTVDEALDDSGRDTGSRFVLRPAGGRWPKAALVETYECGELWFDCMGSEHGMGKWIEALRASCPNHYLNERSSPPLESVHEDSGTPSSSPLSRAAPHNVFQSSTESSLRSADDLLGRPLLSETEFTAKNISHVFQRSPRGTLVSDVSPRDDAYMVVEQSSRSPRGIKRIEETGPSQTDDAYILAVEEDVGQQEVAVPPRCSQSFYSVVTLDSGHETG